MDRCRGEVAHAQDRFDRQCRRARVRAECHETTRLPERNGSEQRRCIDHRDRHTSNDGNPANESRHLGQWRDRKRSHDLAHVLDGNRAKAGLDAANERNAAAHDAPDRGAPTASRHTLCTTDIATPQRRGFHTLHITLSQFDHSSEVDGVESKRSEQDDGRLRFHVAERVLWSHPKHKILRRRSRRLAEQLAQAVGLTR